MIELLLGIIAATSVVNLMGTITIIAMIRAKWED